MFKTALESPDLNMDFRSFDNVLKQLFTKMFLCKNSVLSILLYGAISLSDATAYDNSILCVSIIAETLCLLNFL